MMLAWVFLLLPLISASSECVDGEEKAGALDALIKMSGKYASELTIGADSLDKAISNDKLVMLIQNLSSNQAEAMGSLLAQMSPERFDSLCTHLVDLNLSLDFLVKGYPHMDSYWKRLSLPKVDGFTINAENAAYYPLRVANDSIEDWAFYCDQMASRPGKIWELESLNECIKYWQSKGELAIVRRAYLETPITRIKLNIAALAFEGKPSEEHFQFLLKFLPYDSTLVIPDGFSKEQMAQLNMFVNRLPDNLSLRGYANEPNAEGVWPSPGYLGPKQHPVLRNLNLKRPMKLTHAFDAYYHFGISEILDNTLHLIDAAHNVLGVEFEEMNMAFFAWFSNQVVYNERVLQIFNRVLKYFKPHPYWDPWNWLPLFEAIVKNDAGVYPVEVVNWASQGIQVAPGRAEDDFFKVPESDRPYYESNILNLAISNRWTKAMAQDWELKPSHLYHLDYDSIAFILNYSTYTKDKIDSFLASMIPSMAVSANFKLLNVILDFRSPSEILSLPMHAGVSNRLEVMLHLCPKVTSHHDGAPVDKNSPAFTRWVMYKCTTDNRNSVLAQMLDYYFVNRLSGAYPNYDAIKYDYQGSIWAHGIVPDPNIVAQQRPIELKLTF